MANPGCVKWTGDANVYFVQQVNIKGFFYITVKPSSAYFSLMFPLQLKATTGRWGYFTFIFWHIARQSVLVRRVSSTTRWGLFLSIISIISSLQCRIGITLKPSISSAILRTSNIDSSVSCTIIVTNVQFREARCRYKNRDSQ